MTTTKFPNNKLNTYNFGLSLKFIRVKNKNEVGVEMNFKLTIELKNI